jgi:hypothetical protein
MKIVSSLSECTSDVIPPVITITGGNIININQGDSYTDLGATATDNRDGDITSKIAVTSNVNPSFPGSYTVTYSVTDVAGNIGTSTRTVNVVDNVVPIVSFETNGNTSYGKSRSTVVNVADAGGIDVLKYLWNTSTAKPAESNFSTSFTNGSTISTPVGVTGSYYLWIIAKDATGNTNIVSSNVFNLDNIAPVITLNGTSPFTIGVGSTYNDAGATATDDNSGISGNVTATSNVNPSVPGTYTVTYNISDLAGNAATTVNRTVNVVISEFAYNYTGNVQTFTAPVAGNYKLEVWGAQGGGASNNGGLGGYSAGIKSLTAGQKLYVYIGGQGETTAQAGTTAAGGWNGGGAGGTYYSSYFLYFNGGGGGATDIRTTPTEARKIFLTDRYTYGDSFKNLVFSPGTYYITVYGGSFTTFTMGITTTCGTVSGITVVNDSELTFTLTIPTAISNGTIDFSRPSTTGISYIMSLSTTDNRIIVAGGGGGSGYYTQRKDGSYTAYGYKKGGLGGGLTGGGSNTSFSGTQVINDGQGTSGYGGGTQTGGASGYGGGDHGILYFGGGTPTATMIGAGGGGGYYGGGSGYYGSYDDYQLYTYEESFNGAGGSGYIGGVTGGSTSSGIRTGNGYAKITYVP